MEEEKKDVKQPDATGSEDPAEKKDSSVGDDVKAHEQKAEELLAGEKRILVDKDRFNKINDRAKLFDDNAPLLEKVLKDPDLVERLLEKEKGEDIASRVARLEEEKKAEKRKEVKDAVVDALSRFPNLEKEWEDLKPTFDSLSKRYSAKEALSRAYIALHPEAAQAEAERMAMGAVNKEGVFSSGGAYSPSTGKMGSTKLTEADKRNAKSLGKTEQEYSKMLEKWDAYGKEHGWDKF